MILVWKKFSEISEYFSNRKQQWKLKITWNNKGAYDAALSWAKEKATREVINWLINAQNNKKIDYFPEVFQVEIGFTHAFWHLLLGTEYTSAMEEVRIFKKY